MHHLIEHINRDIKRRLSKDTDSTVQQTKYQSKTEIHQVNQGGPDNSQSIRPIPSHL